MWSISVSVQHFAVIMSKLLTMHVLLLIYYLDQLYTLANI